MLLGVLTITFTLVSLIPGDVAIFYAGPHASAQVIAETRHSLGLDQPKIVQFVRYLWLTLHGDFGQSATLDEPVLTAILQRLPATALLAGAVIVIEMVHGAALRHAGRARRATGRSTAPWPRWPRWASRCRASGSASCCSIVVAFKLKLLPLGGYGDPVCSI